MKIVRAVFWWTITIITLFVLDDLVFGPIFWGLAVFTTPIVATVVAFCSSWAFGTWLVRAGLKDEPSKLAQGMLNRLMLGHKNSHIHRREESLKRNVASAAGALVVTPLVGGVIPSLLLRKHELMAVDSIRRYSVLLCAIYALEFAAIHGGYGFGAAARGIFG